MAYRQYLNAPPQYTLNGLAIPNADYIAMVETNATTETYTYKLGGASGSTVATLVVVYTDSSKETLSTVTLT